MNENSYPHFIKNTPHGVDKYEGKSAERTAEAIKKHIINYDSDENLPKIIGLEGCWGSGKSNIIRLLEKKLEKKFFVFEYDAWGHQEDLQRRSFLETLTNKLIFAENGKLLNPHCSKKNKDGKKEKWNEKLENLLARKRSTFTKTKPKFSIGIIVTILIFIFTPITSTIANDSTLSLTNKLIIALAPIIFAIFLWILASIIKWRIIWNELFEIYSDENIEKEIKETISENEPTVKEFTDWMDDLSNDLNKQLVIVFDNMDRLPAEKVKELWSSIHTFFAEINYPKIWVIIPFDRPHLANAFGENHDKISIANANELTSHFINKTFPVVYRVTPPVMTDWKKIFNEFFKEAFGENEDNLSIQRIFGLIRKNFTPRDIIAFINELVSIKRTWDNEIPLKSISVFVLKKEEILKSPTELILNKTYLKTIEKIIEDTDELQIHITALTYGVDIELAKQLPLMKYLEGVFIDDKFGDINKYSDHNHFVEILDEALRELDIVLLNNAIIRLAEFKSEKNDITSQWNYLVKMFLTQKIELIVFEDTHKALLLNADSEHRSKFIKCLFDNFYSLNDFKGDLFYKTLETIELFVAENKLGLNNSDFIREKYIAADAFIDYANEAKKEYKKYRIICNNNELNNYLISLFPSKVPQMDFVEYLVEDDIYSFDSLNKRIENAIVANEIDANNFYEILKTYKFISKEKPLDKLFTNPQIQALINSTTDKSSNEYYDLAAMALAIKLIDIPFVEGLDVEIAKRIEYYSDYGSLLLSSINWASNLLRKSLKIITENKDYGLIMNVEDVLPFFEQIKNAIGVTDEIFLNRLNEWLEFAKEEIDVNSISTIIPDYKFYIYSTTTINDLTKFINSVAIDKIISIPIEDLYAQRNVPDNYWFNSTQILIKGGVIETLPDNLTEFCKKILIDISSSSQIIPVQDSFIDIILKKAEKKNLQPTIKIICVDFCNKTKAITPDLFLYFSKEFDFLKRVNSRDGDISSFILNPIIKNVNCLNYILESSAYFEKIINNAGDDANDLKVSLKQVMESNGSEKLKSFANSIGIINEEQSS